MALRLAKKAYPLTSSLRSRSDLSAAQSSTPSTTLQSVSKLYD